MQNNGRPPSTASRPMNPAAPPRLFRIPSPPAWLSGFFSAWTKAGGHRSPSQQEPPPQPPPPTYTEVLRAFDAACALRAAGKHKPGRIDEPSDLADAVMAALGPDAVAYYRALGAALDLPRAARTETACRAAGLSPAAIHHILSASAAMATDATTAATGAPRTLTLYVPFVRWDDSSQSADNVFSLAAERGDRTPLFVMRFLKTATSMDAAFARAIFAMGTSFSMDISRVLDPSALEKKGWPEGPPDAWPVQQRSALHLTFKPGLVSGVIPVIFSASDTATLMFAVEIVSACLARLLPAQLRPTEWVGFPCPRREVLPVIEKNLFAMWSMRMLDLAARGRARARILIKHRVSPEHGNARHGSTLGSEIELDNLSNGSVAVLQASARVDNDEELALLLSPWWSPAASVLASLSVETVVVDLERG